MLHCYRSGFWGLAEIGPGAIGELRLELAATLADGTEVRHELGRVPIEPPPAPMVAAWPATRPADRRRDGHLRPARGPVHRPDRVAACPEPRQLGVRDQRRLLEPRGHRAPAPNHRRGPPVPRLPLAPPARLLPQLRARARAGARRCRVRRAGRPGRRLARGQAHQPARRARLGRTRVQRRPGRHPDRRGGIRDMVGPPADQPHRSALGPRRELGHRRRVAVPAGAARRCAPVSAGPVRALPRPLARVDRARPGRAAPSSDARSTTTSSTGRRRSATPAPT